MICTSRATEEKGESLKMKKLRNLFVLVLTAVIVWLASAGCKNGPEHPTGEHPTSEQATDETPSQEQPSGEHPSAEHPNS